MLVKDDGTLGRAAADRLVAQGPQAIAILETGLYGAEPPARRRIVKTFARIGSREALPILEHIAEYDPDPGVRRAAIEAARRLTP